MGAGKDEFIGFVTDQLEGLGGVLCTRFFGGYSIKSQGVMFAMIMDGSLYFAVDDDLRERYRRLGSRCFAYDTKKGRVDVNRYYEVPADWIEDAGRLVAAARESVEAAGRRVSPRRRSK